MHSAPATFATDEIAWQPSKGRVAMACLIVAESAIFTIFVVAYLYYLGKDPTGPKPKDVLELPIFSSICLIASSFTISIAAHGLAKGMIGRFNFWWVVTILLGGYFLFETGREWHHLIVEKNLTIRTNLFGTTFYSLVGLHASHVIVGLLMLLVVLALSLMGAVKKEHAERAEVIAIYWHFVDVVWIVVFAVVYVIGR